MSAADGRVSLSSRRQTGARTKRRSPSSRGSATTSPSCRSIARIAQLDFSRFDTDGVENVSAEQLDAFVFTERGIYRPGDEVHIGAHREAAQLARPARWSPARNRSDRRARNVARRCGSSRVPAMGFAELSFQTAYESPTGEYQVHLYLVRDGKRGSLLGQADFHVKEFLPDRMKIETHLSKEDVAGWIDPKDVQAFVTLRNLYGTPASERRIVSQMQLAPVGFRFAEFKDYVFHDPLRDENKTPAPQTIELGEKTTDADGKTTVDLDLERFADATYADDALDRRLRSGRRAQRQHLQHRAGFRAAARRRLQGRWRTELHSEKQRARGRRSSRSIPRLHKVAVDKLHFNLVEQTYVSILTQKGQRQLRFRIGAARNARSVPTKSRIGAEGFSYTLPTDAPGTFVLEVLDGEEHRVSRLSFTVVGRGNVSRSLEKNAELAVKLDRPQYNTGDEIEISITAPYTGSGLITIESDKVYAHQWFKSSTHQQRAAHPRAGRFRRHRLRQRFIRSRARLEGNLHEPAQLRRRAVHGEQREAAPADRPARGRSRQARRAAHDRLQNRSARRGSPSSRSTKAFSRSRDFATPDPLAHFFRKAALTVETSQIVDLILPEFSILRNAAGVWRRRRQATQSLQARDGKAGRLLVGRDRRRPNGTRSRLRCARLFRRHAHASWPSPSRPTRPAPRRRKRSCAGRSSSRRACRPWPRPAIASTWA